MPKIEIFDHIHYNFESEKKMMDGIVTGSFDPITLGHIEIIKKASPYFERLYVVALKNKDKPGAFSMNQRRELIALSLADVKNVIADEYDGMTADYMHTHSIKKIIRGIRNEDDEKYEKELANAMNGFDPEFETVFIKSDEKYAKISSTLVRERLAAGESVEDLVSRAAVKRMQEMYKENHK